MPLYEDFWGLTPEKFGECCKSWNETREMHEREEWERMHLHAVMMLQPHCRKGKKLNPKTVLPFPWEKSRAGKKEPHLSDEERLIRLKKLIWKK